MILPLHLEQDQLGLWWATTVVNDNMILSEACASQDDARGEMKRLVKEWEGVEVSEWNLVETL